MSHSRPRAPDWKRATVPALLLLLLPAASCQPPVSNPNRPSPEYSRLARELDEARRAGEEARAELSASKRATLAALAFALALGATGLLAGAAAGSRARNDSILRRREVMNRVPHPTLPARRVDPRSAGFPNPRKKRNNRPPKPKRLPRPPKTRSPR